jgi:hypothetical protein
MPRKDEQQVISEFGVRRTRQLFIMGAAIFFVFFLALVHDRPALFGEFSKNAIFTAQAVIIALFVGFSSYNWRCPSCGKFLQKDVFISSCKHCGSRLR